MNPVRTGLSSIARKDSSKFRRYLFEEMLRHNKRAAFVHGLFQRSWSRGLIARALVLRSLGWILSVKSSVSKESEIVLVHRYANEGRAVEKAARSMPGVRGSISYGPSWTGALHGTRWLAYRFFFFRRKAIQILRVSLKLIERNGFLVGARQTEFLALYGYFLHRLARARVYVCSSESNPEIISAALAAQKLKSRVTYVNHGFLDNDLGWFFHDQLILENQALFERIQPHILPGTSPEISWAKAPPRIDRPRIPDFSEIRRIGVICSIVTKPNRLENIVHACLRTFPNAAIQIRPHPNRTCTGEIFGNLQKLERVEVHSIRKLPPAKTHAKEWDFAIIGGSSTHLELLSAGIPTVYMDFDGIERDHYGFLASGIVPEAIDAGEIPEKLTDAYVRGEWESRFRRYAGGELK